jgi:putative two-component system response regulator
MTATNNLTIMIVDDNRTNLNLMDMLARKIPNCSTLLFSDPTQVLDQLARIDFDIAVVDYQMPGLNGVELIQRMRLEPRCADKPVVIITADHDSNIKLQALEAGAVEFLHKPIEPVEFKTRLRNLARLCEAQRDLHSHANWLQSEVDKATAELRSREEEVIVRLSRAAGYKDYETSQHTVRMARYSGILARHLGMPEEYCRSMQLAAPMHDIGKVGIRDDVLLKRGSLTEEELVHMRSHTTIGTSILADSHCALLRLAAEISGSHHERWDGQGYPAGLAGREIPISGRIAAIADVFDALTTERPYKKAWTVSQAFTYLREQSGRQFDPECVAAFDRAREEICFVRSALTDKDLHAA